jgi:formamidopyrimidine-DNA glycosylase
MFFMPELPEVESVVRSLRDGMPSLVGLQVCSVEILWSGVISEGYDEMFSAELSGSQITGISRHGKYLFFHLEKPFASSRVLVIHLRMTGRLFLESRHAPLNHHTRLALILDHDLVLRFDDPRKFGRAWIINETGEVTAKLGPDALSINYEDFASRIALRNRHIKSLLLDQSVLAGVGNIYADESLFRACIHPNSISGNLDQAEIRSLYDAIKNVIHEAVEAQGANIDGVFKAGSFVVRVYGRQGCPCNVCGTAVIKFRSGQRGTHVCPRCQVLK